MAVIDRTRDLGQESDVLDGPLQLALRIRERESVSRLGSSGDVSDPTFWVFLNTEDPKEAEEIFILAQDSRRAHPGAPRIHLHVMPEAQVHEKRLPPFTLLFSRA